MNIMKYHALLDWREMAEKGKILALHPEVFISSIVQRWQARLLSLPEDGRHYLVGEHDLIG